VVQEPIGDLGAYRAEPDQADPKGAVVLHPAILTDVALLLHEADVERLADMDLVMDALQAAMRDLGEGNAQN